MNKIIIYITRTGKLYLESSKTYKPSKTKTILYEIETDADIEFKKTNIQKEITSTEDVEELLKSIFEE